jgi:alpha-1,6-mannosyltransferase
MAASPIDAVERRPQAIAGDRSLAQRAEAVIGGTALIALVLCMLALGANAASGRSNYVPSGVHRFPGWLAGPLAPLGFTTSHAVLEGLVIAICVCYALVLGCLRSLSARQIWGGVIVGAVAAMLAPPLLSTDIFGYLGFARLGVLHGLSPYSFTANAAPHDAVFPYLGWHTVTTPYGPAFTLLSYALVPLGLAAGMWTLKLIAAATSLATVVLIGKIARRLGRSPRWAVAMYGLNPLVLVFAVGGAHNDTLFGVLLAAAALWMLSGRDRAAAVATVGAIAVKVSAGLMLPFAWLGARRRRAFLNEAVAAVVLTAAISFAIFGTHLSGIEHALVGEQSQLARHGVPEEISGLLGLGRPNAHGVRLPEGVRVTFIVLFAMALVATLWRAWRGAWWLDCYAWATLALLACSAWLLPWYGMWALLPASVSGSRRLQAVTLAASAYLVAIKIL